MEIWRGRSPSCGYADLRRRDAVPGEKRTQISLRERTLFQEGRSSDLRRRDAVPGEERTQISLRERTLFQEGRRAEVTLVDQALEIIDLRRYL